MSRLVAAVAGRMQASGMTLGDVAQLTGLQVADVQRWLTTNPGEMSLESFALIAAAVGLRPVDTQALAQPIELPIAA